MKDEKGQALPLALAALAVGVLLITPFLESVSVHSIASRTYTSSMLQLYSSDAGVEDAIWGLTNGSLADELTAPGDTVSHSVSEAVNDISPSISITRDEVTVASDGFESGGWSGGSGWLDAWTDIGDATITKSQGPYEGSYHLQLRRNTGYVKRAVDLSGQSSARLQFQAKVSSFEGSEEAYCKVSSNGNDWTTVKTWAYGDDDDAYHYHEIDLAPYALSSQFWIAFEANMQQANDYLYIDDIEVVGILPGATVGLPSDRFKSGGWSGGTGWVGDWHHEGDSSITTDEGPYEGSYHLRMRSDSSYVKRAADLAGESSLRLQFKAKVSELETGDEIYCQVSPDDSSWTTVKTWTSADSDDTYHFYDIDLSSHAPYSSEFWIAFTSGMDSPNDRFCVDDLRIVGAIAYRIVATAGNERTRADIVIDNGDVSIRSWQMERQQE